jgi:hypothetical protein
MAGKAGDGFQAETESEEEVVTDGELEEGEKEEGEVSDYEEEDCGEMEVAGDEIVGLAGSGDNAGDMEEDAGEGGEEGNGVEVKSEPVDQVESGDQGIGAVPEASWSDWWKLSPNSNSQILSSVRMIVSHPEPEDGIEGLMTIAANEDMFAILKAVCHKIPMEAASAGPVQFKSASKEIEDARIKQRAGVLVNGMLKACNDIIRENLLENSNKRKHGEAREFDEMVEAAGLAAILAKKAKKTEEAIQELPDRFKKPPSAKPSSD